MKRLCDIGGRELYNHPLATLRFVLRISKAIGGIEAIIVAVLEDGRQYDGFEGSRLEKELNECAGHDRLFN